MKKLIKFSKVSMLTAMAAVVMVMLPSNSECPAVDPLDHTVLLPCPGNCADFYSCSNGVAILMHCPDGLHFNAELDVCDWPACAKCEDGATELPAGVKCHNDPKCSVTRICRDPFTKEETGSVSCSGDNCSMGSNSVTCDGESRWCY